MITKASYLFQDCCQLLDRDNGTGGTDSKCDNRYSKYRVNSIHFLRSYTAPQEHGSWYKTHRIDGSTNRDGFQSGGCCGSAVGLISSKRGVYNEHPRIWAFTASLVKKSRAHWKEYSKKSGDTEMSSSKKRVCVAGSSSDQAFRIICEQFRRVNSLNHIPWHQLRDKPFSVQYS